MASAAKTAISEFGRIDILIANAGVWTGKPATEFTYEEFSTVVDVNLNGVFNAVNAVVGHMVDRRYGRIIATASAAGRSGTQNLSSYTASKWGVIGLVKCLAKELGAYNITVNAINVDGKVIGLGMHILPVARIPASDIAKVAVFLASADARYITGSTVDVDAGISASHT